MARRQARPGLPEKKGDIERAYLSPPPGSRVICYDQMGPVSARRYRGKRFVRRPVFDCATPKGRAAYKVELHGRGRGHVFGAFDPHTGAAYTQTYVRRNKAAHLSFLSLVDAWIGPGAAEVVCILDNLNIHHAPEMLLFMATHPRWEFAYIPSGAAYLNLIEPWWKTLRSLALEGRSFANWRAVEDAFRRATEYWNQHKHPYRWGHRRRHRTPRKPGVAQLSKRAGFKFRQLAR